MTGINQEAAYAESSEDEAAIWARPPFRNRCAIKSGKEFAGRPQVGQRAALRQGKA
jgi:hypothetical protein